MVESVSKDKKPLVGFFPLFYNLAETGRAVMMAKRYMELGGEAIFFSHGGQYEYLAKNIGCKVVRVNPIYTEEFIDFLWKSSRLETFKNPFSKKNLMEHVCEEISAYRKTGIKMIVSTNNFPCILSARVMKIPLVCVTPKGHTRFTYYPDDAEFFFTRILPSRIKLKILNWYALNSKRYVRPFAKVAKKYNIAPPKNEYDLNRGDYTLYTDFKEMLDTDKSKLYPNEHYVGPIFFDELFVQNLSKEDTSKDDDIYKHLKKNGRSILVSLGSSGTKKIFLQILNALNKTNYNVIALYTSILQENELPIVNDNILLKKFVLSIEKVNKMVDLAVIHGGQGTVYTAAYAGKPVIGFPMQFEQHLNLEILVKKKMAIIASRKYFNEQKFLNDINKIFSNYSFYFNNAQNLSKKLPEPEGDKIAAGKIIEILQQ